MSLQRTQGHNWERECIVKIAEILELEHFKPSSKNEFSAEIGSTRMFSKRMDNEGIDIWFKEMFANIQCKKTLSKGKNVTTIDIQSLIDLEKKFPKGNNILLTKVTRKGGSRESKIGEYMTVPLSLGLALLLVLKASYDNTRKKE